MNTVKIITLSLLLTAFSSLAFVEHRMPDVVIAFKNDSSRFNNIVELESKINTGNGLMISANTNTETLAITEKRIQNIVEKLEPNKFVYTTFRYTNNPVELNHIEVFSLKTHQEFKPLIKVINKSSMVTGLGRLYTEGAIRKWRYEADEMDILLTEGISANEQLIELLHQVKWSVESAPAFLNENGNLLDSMPLKMKVVLVNGEMASVDEVQALVESWLDIYGEANRHSVFVNKKDNKVVVK